MTTEADEKYLRAKGSMVRQDVVVLRGEFGAAMGDVGRQVVDALVRNGVLVSDEDVGVRAHRSSGDQDRVRKSG